MIQEEPEAPAKVVDLMEALNASIAAAAKLGSKGATTKPAAKRAPARRAAPAARKAAKKAAKQPARAKAAPAARLPEPSQLVGPSGPSMASACA